MGEKRWKRDNLEDPDIYGRKILGWFLKKHSGTTETELTWFRIGTSGVLL
jgi:hypothetical protein